MRSRHLIPLLALVSAAAFPCTPDAAGHTELVDFDTNGDGEQVSGERLKFWAKPTPGATITKVEITLDRKPVRTIEGAALPAAAPDGRMTFDLEYRVGAAADDGLKLPVHETPVMVITTTDSAGKCSRTDASRLSTRNTGVYAVVVGINLFSGNRKPLQFARRDAEAMAEHLVSNIDGATYDSVKLLTDPLPAGQTDTWKGKRDIATRSKINRALTDAVRSLDTSGTLIFYFSGHGFATKQTGFRPGAFLVPVETDLSYDDGLLGVAEIVDKMAGAGVANNLFILDACFSDVAIAPDAMYISGRALGPIRNTTAIQPFLSNEAVYIAVSSTGDQLSYEINDKQHGAFTYYLLNSNTLTEKPRDMTIGSVFDVVVAAVEEEVDRVFKQKQRPKQVSIGPGNKVRWIRNRPPGS